MSIPTSLPKEKAPLQYLRRRFPRQQSSNTNSQLLSQKPPPKRLILDPLDTYVSAT